MRAKLELVLTAFMLITGVMVISSYARTYMRERSKVLHVGDHLPAIGGLNYAEHDRTLILMLKTGCEFCDASMPFYRELATASNARHQDTFLVAVIPEDASIEEQILMTHKVPISVIGHIALNSMKVTGTPTLVLLDKQGAVQKLWVGQLSQQGEHDVLLQFSVTRIPLHLA